MFLDCSISSDIFYQIGLIFNIISLTYVLKQNLIKNFNDLNVFDMKSQVSSINDLIWDFIIFTDVSSLFEAFCVWTD